MLSEEELAAIQTFPTSRKAIDRVRDIASVTEHLAVLAHIRGNLDARAEYIKRLPADKLNEVLEIIMKL